MPQSVGVEAESWTECELNLGWAQVVRLLLHLQHGLFILHETKPFYWYRYSKFGSTKNRKKKTLKSGRVFLATRSMTSFWVTANRSSNRSFSCSSPAATKKHKNWSLFYFRFIPRSISYFLSACVFSYFFFWAKMLHYFLGHLEEVRSYMAMKMKPSSGESGLLISEWKSKTHNKCMAFEIRGPHGRALADRLCHGAWVVRLRGLLKKASTGRN